jgi:hypothetical protein
VFGDDMPLTSPRQVVRIRARVLLVHCVETIDPCPSCGKHLPRVYAQGAVMALQQHREVLGVCPHCRQPVTLGEPLIVRAV